MDKAGEYLFVVCQVGAEVALKAELAREWPGFRFAYSRPGFVTFKLSADMQLAEDFDLRAAFARTYGFSLGRLRGQQAGHLASEVWHFAGERDYAHLHVWQRDTWLPGERGFEPGVTPLAREVAEAIANARPSHRQTDRPLAVNRAAQAGELVLDCVLIEPDEWLVGFHRAASVPSRFPGGVCALDVHAEPISRAYWKMVEALTWSQLPVTRGDRCAEIGSAPGGASQALLAAGLRVMGIDPAEMDAGLLREPHFTHVKKRAADMKRREFRGVRWLMADLNVAPPRTLATVEAIVTHHEVNVRGLLLTLKLADWQLAAKIPEYLARVRSWGYRYVRARQLAFNRREVCVAALRERSLRRAPPWKVQARKREAGRPGRRRSGD